EAARAVRDRRAGAAVPDVVEVLQHERERVAGPGVELEMPVAGGAVGGAALVVVQQADVDGAAGVDLPIQRRAVLEVGVDVFEGHFGVRERAPALTQPALRNMPLGQSCQATGIGEPRERWIAPPAATRERAPALKSARGL